MLLANGRSELRCTKNITDHTKSCFYIFKQFFPHFEYNVLEEKDTDRAIIQIQGHYLILNKSLNVFVGLGLGAAPLEPEERKEIS